MIFKANIFAQSPFVIDLLHLILLVLLIGVTVLWLQARKSATTDTRSTQPAPPVEEPAPAVATPVEPVVEEPPQAPDTSALQLLTLLQQDARFVDFINEDLAGFGDADIGAVARTVHAGSRKTLQTYFAMQPLRSESEESRVTVEEGFDAARVRLTGNLVGQAPFSGTLVHRGWEVTEVRLPKVTEGHDSHVIAPAEVEL